MGGRGSFSMTHGGVAASGGGGTGYIPKTPESREDIRELFINRLGFQELYGTDKIGTAQMSAIAQELTEIEQEYHVLRDNKVYLATTSNAGVYGYAMHMRDGSYLIALNSESHNNVGSKVSRQREMARSGFKTKTDGKINSDYSYTIRHEYGHVKQFAISEKTEKTPFQIRKEVQNIAKTSYNTKKSPSRYANHDEYEFFAESFASLTGGRPSGQGKALKKWLKDNRL